MARVISITLLLLAVSLNTAYSQGVSTPTGSTDTSANIIKIPIGNKAGSNNSNTRPSLFPAADKPTAKLVTDKPKYMPGNKAGFTFTVINDKKKTYHYNFPSSQQFDIIVTNNAGQMVWKLSSMSSYTQALTAFDLKPQQGKVYYAAWVLPANIKPGKYNIQAVMTPQIRPAIRGGSIISTDNDPNNIGLPTRNNAETGAAIQVNTVAPASAAASLIIVAKN